MSRGRLIVAVVASVAVALFAAVSVGLAYATLPELPPAPELDDVDLSPPPSAAVSEVLERALSRPRDSALDTDDWRFLERQLEGLTEGRWLDDPEAVIARVTKASEEMASLRAALAAGGCLGPDRSAEDLLALVHDLDAQLPPRPDLLNLARAADVLLLLEIARAQRGRPELATANVLALLEQVLRLQRECARHRGDVEMLERTIDTIHGGLAFSVASQESAPELWTKTLELERETSPLADAFRRDDSLELSVGGALGPDGASSPERAPTIGWARLFERRARRSIWLAELPASHDALRAETPEGAFSRALRDRSWLLREIDERLLVPLVHGAPWEEVQGWTDLTEERRPLVLAWHESRCLMALRRARWQRELLDRGRPLPAAWAASPPQDRLADRPIDLEATDGRLCDTGLAGAPRGERLGDRLPPPPPP